MNLLFQPASRLLSANLAVIPPPRSTSAIIRGSIQSVSNPPVCIRCRVTFASLQRGSRSYYDIHEPPNKRPRRHFSTSRRFLEKQSPHVPQPPLDVPNQIPQTAEPSPIEKTNPTTAKVEDNIKRVAAEDLPSHKEGQRWNFSKRFQELMDDLLPKIAVVTHKVNTYTGTDYSGIEALRNEIKEQEKLVKARRLAVDTAKEAFDAAHVRQAASQKEVVGLLERKHSWSAADLERYMSLIRSEHVNDQAVNEAKDSILAAESALEEARTRLEKRERAQYHEEQIWSDTIRRNSTWVTFGLMGFNILLLLASLVIIEPWRRRRLVREFRTALDAQRSMLDSTAVPPTSTAVMSAIEAAVEPAGAPAQESEVNEPVNEAHVPITGVEEKSRLHQAVPDISADLSGPEPSIFALEQAETVAATDIAQEVRTDAPPLPWHQKINMAVKDLMSDRSIDIRMIDLTTTVLQGAAAGALISGTIVMLLVRST